ncbi:hypothetical protein ACLIBH_13750, partial [Virgibacillus sp. W0430]|uniref:hypothetical protein n=1 Tax=Virgibacillus sp. W0430 TaxID=3391580 RepID=UPI003F45D72E
MKVISSLKSNELIFVLYLSIFALAKPLLQAYQQFSTIILFLITVVIIIFSLFLNITNIKGKQLIAFWIITFFLSLFIIDLLFRSNDYTIQLLYEFFIYAAIPLFLFSFVENYKMLLKLYSYFSCVIFFMYILDPINEYALSETYMNFSFLSMLPAYYGLYIGRRVFKMKWMFPLEMCSLISLAIFGNKGALLAAVFFLVLMDLFL